MQEPLPITFTYRIIGVDGTVKVANLPHDSSKWSIKFMQPGVVGAAVIGTFSIVCPPPASNAAMLAQDDLDKITEQMRVEAYLGDAVAGDPLLTGIIRQRPTKMNGFELKGSDITILAQTALTGRNEIFNGSTDTLVTSSLKAYKLLFRDKFNNLSQWTNSGVWTTDTNNGPSGVGLNIPAAKHTASGTGDGLLLSTTSFAYADYANAYVDTLYTLECGTTPGNIAEGGVVMGASDSNNLILGRAMMTCVNSKTFRIDAEIWKKTAGSYGATPKKSIKKVINGIKPDQLIKVTMTSKGVGSPSYSALVTLDGPFSWWHCDDASAVLTDAMPRLNHLPSNGGASLLYHQTAIVLGSTYGVGNAWPADISLWGNGVDGNVLTTLSDVAIPGKASSYGFYDNFSMEAWIVPRFDRYDTEFGYIHGGIIMANWGLGGVHDWGMFVGNDSRETGVLNHLWIMHSAGNQAADSPLTGERAYDTGYQFPVAGVPYHVVIVRLSGTWYAYVNSVLVNTQPLAAPRTGEREAFSIGGISAADPINNFDGRIDEAAVYNYPLTAAQIAAHYQLGISGPNTEYRVILNGRDSGCAWTDLAAPSGSVGLRSVSGTVWAANYAFPSKAFIFNPGSIAPGVLGINQVFSNTPMLDRWNISAVTEGVAWRVIRHPFIDSVDWGPNVGDDKTALVHLREGSELQHDSSVEPNTDPPATVIRLSGGAGQDNSGFIEWIDLDAADKYGLVYDPMSAQNVSDTTAQIMLAKKFAHLRGTPGFSKILHFTRTIDNAEKFTVGDFIKATAAKLNMFDQTVQVMGLDYEEGKADMVATCDQYPASWTVTDMRRVRQELDALANGTANLSPSSSGGLVYDAKTGSPFILPVWSGYEPVDSTHKMRIRFEIPANLGVLQKIIVNFSQLPFRAGSQTTSGASSASTTSGGSSHSHTFTGQSVDTGVFTHVHNMLIKSGAATDAVSVDHTGANTWLHNASGSDTTVQTAEDYPDNTFASQGHAHALTGVTSNSEGTHTHGMAHTHSVNAPNGLFETGMARNTHLYVDDGVGGFVDVSTLVTPAGPWDGAGAELDVSEIDITPYLTGGGFHEIQLSSTAIGGIKAAVYVFGILQSI